MSEKNLVCIGCPLGCELSVSYEVKDGVCQVEGVTGNTCKKGDSYARKELTNPTRMVTSTISVIGGTREVVSVKVSEEIPKEKIKTCIDAIKEEKIEAPVKIGQILVENIAQLGVNLIATDSLQRG